MNYKTKTVDGVTYQSAEHGPRGICDGCAAEDNIDLCLRLGNCSEDDIIWVAQVPYEPAEEQAKEPAAQAAAADEIMLAMQNYGELARAVGGTDILDACSALELLRILAQSGITIKATHADQH